MGTYSIGGYGEMILDTVRMQAYTQALRQAVKPGCVVLDIGSGTGIATLLACRMGAGRVYAVEPDDAIVLAREIAAANRCADRITFIQDLSTRVTLPEPADVIVSDLRGILPLFQQHIVSIIDARRRHLAPRGVMIPERDHLWAAVVEAPETYESFVCPWRSDGHGFDMEAARRVVTNTWRKARVKPEQLLVEPQSWATLHYATVEDVDVQGQLTWSVERAGTVHGVSVWFDAELLEGVCYSNAPTSPELIYSSAFFPLARPVNAEPGDTIDVGLAANLVGDDYVWRWNTRVRTPSSCVKAEFRQSTLFGAPLALNGLSKRAANHMPQLREEGRIDRLVLKLMDGRTALEEIAERITDGFPSRFATREKALSYVADLSQRYS